MTLRTSDESYSRDYWNSLDGGRGYQDGTYWEDLACAIKETFGYSWPNKKQDISLGLKVLDLGCAMGYLVRHLRRRDMLGTWGCDISQYAISQAAVGVRPYLKKYDLTSETSPMSGSVLWDLVISLETLEHIEEEQVPQALRNIRESLKYDTGMALLSICTDEVPGYDTDPTHVCIKSREWWSDQLANAGLGETDPDRVESLRNWRFFKGHPGLFLVKRTDS